MNINIEVDYDIQLLQWKKYNKEFAVRKEELIPCEWCGKKWKGLDGDVGLQKHMMSCVYRT